MEELRLIKSIRCKLGNLLNNGKRQAFHDWRAALGHLSAIVTFLIGIFLSLLIVRPLKEVAVVAVASHDYGHRSDSDSDCFFGASIRFGPWS
jgi:hypothetical protein